MIQAPSRWAIHVVDPLPVCVSGHIGLLGDAVGLDLAFENVGFN